MTDDLLGEARRDRDTARVLAQKLAEALRPFADYAKNIGVVPENFALTKGSELARRQLYPPHFRVAREALAEYEASPISDKPGKVVFGQNCRFPDGRLFAEIRGADPLWLARQPVEIKELYCPTCRRRKERCECNAQERQG